MAIFCAGAAAPGLFAQAGAQELKLTVGKSVVIDYPSDVGRISTSNPDIVDAVPISFMVHRMTSPSSVVRATLRATRPVVIGLEDRS